MAFVNENTITLTGAYVNADGSPASGSLTFVPEAFLTDAGAKQIIAPTALKVSLSGTGTFSIALPATDDPDINPIGWTYQVTEQISGAPQRQFAMSLPVASLGATLDMAALTPAAASTGVAAPYLLVPSGTPTVGQVPVVTTVSPLALGWGAGGGGGAVSSVAGRTGAVTLAKADVGLGNVDNTADASKPVSTAQAAADALAAQKSANLSDLANAGTARTNLGLGTAATQASTAFDTAGAATAAQAAAVQRANHTGTQLASTISDFNTAAVTAGNAAFESWLTPSGGDDSAAIAAAITATGRAKLAPGVFLLNTPQILRAKNTFRSDVNAYEGLAIDGSGIGVTILDTSGASLTSHLKATVTAITVGATTTGTLSAACSWADGSQVVVTLPSYRRSIDSGNTIDLLNGQVVFIKATNRSVGTFTTFQLYCDAALTTALVSTGWGTFATPCTIRRYESDRTLSYTPALRLTGPLTGPTGAYPDIYNLRVSNLTFRNTQTEAISYERQGICISMESDRATSDTIICQQARFDSVRFEGYDCSVLMDDCTTVVYNGCDFHGNNFATWYGFNTDIVNYFGCAFGDDFPVQGQPLQQVASPALVYYAPINPSQDYSGSRNSVSFDSCWFMGVRAITGGEQLGTFGSQVYFSKGLNPRPLSLKNCYFEQVSWLAQGQQIHVDSCHFGNFMRDANLTSARAVFNLQTDNYDGARFTIENCTCDGSEGAGPAIAYVSASNWGTNGGQANEETTPTIVWRNNDLPAGSGAAHIIDFLNTARKVLLDDNFATGVQVKAGGDYTFEGILQVAGRTRMKRTGTPVTGTVTPDICSATRYWVGLMGGNITIANPIAGSGTVSSLFASQGVSTSSFFMFAPLRMLPLEFIFEQDATGSRTITFGTDFVTTGLTLTGGTAGQKTIIRFQWNGSKWVPLNTNAWA